MPLILPGNVGSATASTTYDVANSARFDDGSSDNLQRTYGTPTNAKIFGLSWWIKISKTGAQNDFWGERADTSNRVITAINTDGTFQYFEKNGGSTALDLKTNRLFRDVSAWYHFLILVDTTQGTASNRLKLYINGVQETSFATETYPAENYTPRLSTNTVKYFGRVGNGGSLSSNYINGYLAEAAFVDGTVTAHTDYGEFDEDSPTIWKPIDVSGFEDSSALGNDVSGNNNDFTANNLTATDQSTDTCTNNFATMNPLANKVTSVTFSEGNLKTDFANGRGGSSSTFGLTTGKWYVEKKITTMPQDERFHLGVVPFEIQAADDMINTDNQGIGISGFNAVIYADSGSGSAVLDNFFGNNTTRFDSWTGIIGMALDITNGTIAFSKDGAWVTGSGTTDTDFSNASKINISTPLARHDVWHVACGTGNSTGTSGVFSMNFGSPPYAISSGNADGNGYGNFEYAVPANYYSLCTKNLAEYG